MRTDVHQVLQLFHALEGGRHDLGTLGPQLLVGDPATRTADAGRLPWMSECTPWRCLQVCPRPPDAYRSVLPSLVRHLRTSSGDLSAAGAAMVGAVAWLLRRWRLDQRKWRPPERRLQPLSTLVTFSFSFSSPFTLSLFGRPPSLCSFAAFACAFACAFAAFAFALARSQHFLVCGATVAPQRRN